jgi:threonine/homoserine/homoserine lactone efflux protein
MKSILNKEKLNLEKKDVKEKTISFLQGFSIAILNPKILVWFIAIYSQFMSVNNELMLNIYLISIAGIVDALWYVFLTFAITTSSTLSFFQKNLIFLQRIQGIFFIGLGMALLAHLLV